MSSSSSPMDYQKHVKVKSRWTQSCQMEMMMEESQSSLDNMSDTIDVSSSKINECTDYSFESNSIELRRSRRTGSNKTDYRQLNGLKTKQQKPSVTSKASNKKSRKRKQLFKFDKNEKFENNMSQESNIIKHPLIDWNNVKICQLSKKSKSVNNISEIIAKLPLKPIRRASLAWNFKYTSTNDIEDNSNLLKKESYDNPNGIIHSNLNKTRIETSLSIDNKELCNDYKSTFNESTMNENTSQHPKLDVDVLNSNDFEHENKVLNTNVDKISVINLNKQKQSDELNKHINQCNTEVQYQVITPKYSFSELENLVLGPVNSFGEIRSKSFDSLMIKTNCVIKRSRSYGDISKLEDSTIDVFKLEKKSKEPIPKKRRQSKRIKYKTNSIEIPDDIQVPEVNYDQIADEIYKEHQNQLLEARINDKEFDKKLESTNFTLVNENLYRPNR